VAAQINERLRRGVDLVHIHGVWQHAPHAAARAARAEGVPYIVRPCGMLDPWCLNQGRLKKRVFLALLGRRQLPVAGTVTSPQQGLGFPRA